MTKGGVSRTLRPARGRFALVEDGANSESPPA